MDLSLEVSYALRATASLSIDAPINTTHKTILMRNPYEETVARRRSAALLSGFGLGHVREYAPSTLTLSALHLILRAKSLHICVKCARMALRATFSV